MADGHGVFRRHFFAIFQQECSAIGRQVFCHRVIEAKLPLPAYDYCMKCSHTFNLLDARGAISITERAGYIARVRTLASGVAHLYAAQREAMGYPMLKKG